MPVCAQMQSGSASLSGDQIRDLLRQALDRIDQLQSESKAAQDYISSLETTGKKNDDLINSLKERDQIRQDTIKALDTQVAALNQALAVSQKATADAVAEAAREKKRAGRWKSIAKFGIMGGIALGAVAALAIGNH